jgi:hypothetical protein
MSDSTTFVADKFVTTLNNHLRAGECDAAQQMMNVFSNIHVPEKAGVVKGMWTLDFTDKRIHDGTVCLLAHSSTAKRALAILRKLPSGSSEEEGEEFVPPTFRYTFDKLAVKKKKRTADGIILEKIASASNLSKRLFTPRRGFWLIWSGSLDQCITKENMVEHERLLVDWYENYVNGMEKAPNNRLLRIRKDFGFEQFKLGSYPTEKWRENTTRREDSKTIHFEDQENGGPPPPPLLPPAPTTRTRKSTKKTEAEAHVAKVEATVENYAVEVPPFEVEESEYNYSNYPLTDAAWMESASV